MTYIDRQDHPHWVYRCYDDAGRLLYVGCSMNLRGRRQQHKAGSLWFQYMHHAVLRGPYDYVTARRVEREQINELDPFFNETSEQLGERTRYIFEERRFQRAFFAANPHASTADFYEAFESHEFENRIKDRHQTLAHYLASRGAAA